MTQGWRYKENKHLDLCPDFGYDLLTPHEKKPAIHKVVNLHDELPEGLKQMRVKEANSDSAIEYDIRGIWKILCQKEPEAVKNAIPFNYEDKPEPEQQNQEKRPISPEKVE